MKLENHTKRELIALVTEIRPKAEAYDRVCEEKSPDSPEKAEK